jgi:hypothetical protein
LSVVIVSHQLACTRPQECPGIGAA